MGEKNTEKEHKEIGEMRHEQDENINRDKINSGAEKKNNWIEIFNRGVNNTL